MRNGQVTSARAFTQLSPLVLHAPATSPPAKKEADSDEPELVVLFGWSAPPSETRTSNAEAF